MTTSYPGALDSLTNPAAGDPTTAPSHATQHSNVNDAVEAVEARLGISSGAASLNTISLAGGQIAFPATDVPSANVNTLDDYEEGTFTPVLAYAVPGTSTWAPTVQAGFYTKIGNRVFVHFQYAGVPTNGNAGTGQALQLTGLPFTANAAANSHGRFPVGLSGFTKAGYTTMLGNVVPAGTVMNFLAYGSGVAAGAITVADIPSLGSVSVSGSGSYIV